MATHGRSAAVRSHRRGGPRRRVSLTPWLVVAAAVLLVGGGATASYALLVRGGCSGQAEATIMVTPRIEPIVKRLGQDWTQSRPSVNGTCGSVNVVSAESAQVATALTGEWDPVLNGPEPDVWVPDSSAWARKASADSDAERMMPDLQPSLARTPTVIAMPEPLAEAAGMTAQDLTWREIIEKLSVPDGWSAYDRGDLGPFRIGLSDPQASTAGLLALMAISDSDDDGEVSDEERVTLLSLKNVITLTATTTAEILDGFAAAAEDGGADGALGYVSAFPALEQDVLQFNLGNPTVPLVAIYPTDGMAEADFPYLILRATPWSDPQRRAVAAEFMTYARGPTGEAAFLAEGFRDSNRVPGPVIVPANGMIEKPTALPRAILLPDSVQLAAASWTAVTRPTNALLVFDTSGSMGGAVAGTGQTRLDLTKAAALNSLSLLDDTARVGVWEFSTSGASGDHRLLLDLAPLEQVESGLTHRERINRAIDGLSPGGNTGLYNTVWAACQEVSEKYVEGAANVVLVLTDGADDNNVSDTITLDELVSNLEDTCGGSAKPVQVITIGLGIDSGSDELRRISAATGAGTFSSPRSFDINQVLLAALFS